MGVTGIRHDTVPQGGRRTRRSPRERWLHALARPMLNRVSERPTNEGDVMTRRSRIVGGSLLLLGAAACGSKQPPEPAITPTPAVHELARLQDMGRLDAVRLSCAADAAIPAVQGAIRLASEPPQEVPRTPVNLSRHAQSVQQSMSGSERLSASMRRATAARAG